MSDLIIRPAAAPDAPLVHSFIRELAGYEKLTHEMVATEDDLRRTLFGDSPGAEVRLGFAGEEPAGFALFFPSYSTFLGRPGIYLEDLFVRPAFRGRGYGRELLAHLAALAVERGAGRLEWSVLDWNEPAIGFYRTLGAESRDEWTTFRLTGPALEALAARRNA